MKTLTHCVWLAVLCSASAFGQEYREWDLNEYDEMPVASCETESCLPPPSLGADLANALNSDHLESRDGFLPIGELQVGLETQTPMIGGHQAFPRLGFEGQLWGDVGNASQLDGDLGFVGFHVGFGFIR